MFRETLECWLLRPCNKKHQQKKTFRNKLLKYGCPENFSEITEEWHESFIQWLEEQGYTRNYIGVFTQNLKVFMNYTYRKGVHNNSEYQLFKKRRETVNHPYLNENEIEKIRLLCNLSEKLQNVRILFLLSYYTGMRFADITRLHSSSISAGIIRFRVAKTNKLQTIPCASFVKENVDKKRPISNQKFNNYLKDLCLRAGIDEHITIERTKGGSIHCQQGPKHLFITAHTARRSFATNFFLRTKDLQATSKFLGHSSISVTENYLKNTINQIAEEYANNEFFR